MKGYSLLFLVLLTTSCSNDWEKSGFNDSQEQNANERGFKNPEDYQAALDLGIYTYNGLITYRNGGFKDIEEFKYALKFKLNSQRDVNSHRNSNCVSTPTYGLVCKYNESYDELLPRFEYHQTKLNNAIDASKIEFALDCKSVKRGKSAFGGHYRTVFIKTNSNLIPNEQKKLMRHSFASMYGQKRDKYTSGDGYYNYISNSNIAIMSFESYTRSYSRNKNTVWEYNVDYETDPYMAIVDGSWFTDDDSYVFSTVAFSSILIDRKTGFGKRKRNPGDPSNVAEGFDCKEFTGDVKTYLKDDNVLTGAIAKEVTDQINLLRKKKAEELARKKKEEDRNKMENKF
tara:strand:- start:69 stop:1097 length:1029 start_codon:yes stop_codon:yes gene_type:complete